MDYKLPNRVENSNKATYGKVLNVAGSDYMPGAAYLSSVSALKTGCGYCFLCSTERVIDAVAAQTQNVVFLPVSKLVDYLKESDVIEIGCGLSQEDTAINLFRTFIENVDNSKKIIFDADALNIISKYPDLIIDKSLKNIVFTPHPREAARLLGENVDNIISDIPLAAKKISNKYNCITVLKTNKTYVCSFDGQEYINTTGNNSMAKAGSGDVLTGMISGLAAQGMDLFEASVLGVHLHGLSGDIAKEKLTEYSVMADDLISFIPNAIKYYVATD